MIFGQPERLHPVPGVRAQRPADQRVQVGPVAPATRRRFARSRRTPGPSRRAASGAAPRTPADATGCGQRPHRAQPAAYAPSTSRVHAALAACCTARRLPVHVDEPLPDGDHADSATSSHERDRQHVRHAEAVEASAASTDDQPLRPLGDPDVAAQPERPRPGP